MHTPTGLYISVVSLISAGGVVCLEVREIDLNPTCSIVATSVSVHFEKSIHAFLMAVQESEPHEYILRPGSGYSDHTDREPREHGNAAWQRIGQICCSRVDGTKVILVDVTSTSGISKHAKLHQYTPGAVAGIG
jgi:hypothetical protein